MTGTGGAGAAWRRVTGILCPMHEKRERVRLNRDGPALCNQQNINHSNPAEGQGFEP